MVGAASPCWPTSRSGRCGGTAGASPAQATATNSRQPAGSGRFRAADPRADRRQGDAGGDLAAARDAGRRQRLSAHPLPAGADLGARKTQGRHDGDAFSVDCYGTLVDRTTDERGGRQRSPRRNSPAVRHSPTARRAHRTAEGTVIRINRRPIAVALVLAALAACSRAAMPSRTTTTRRPDHDHDRRRPRRPPPSRGRRRPRRRRRRSTTTHRPHCRTCSGCRSPASRELGRARSPHRPALVVKIDNHPAGASAVGPQQRRHRLRGDHRGHAHPVRRGVPLARRRSGRPDPVRSLAGHRHARTAQPSAVRVERWQRRRPQPHPQLRLHQSRCRVHARVLPPLGPRRCPAQPVLQHRRRCGRTCPPRRWTLRRRSSPTCARRRRSPGSRRRASTCRWTAFACTVGVGRRQRRLPPLPEREQPRDRGRRPGRRRQPRGDGRRLPPQRGRRATAPRRRRSARARCTCSPTE